MNNLLYIANFSYGLIEIFDLNLVPDSDSIEIYAPCSISGYNNSLYVGDYSGRIFLVVNKLIVDDFDGCINHNSPITSIIFDDYGYLSTSCANKMYLFYSNGIYCNKFLRRVNGDDYNNIGFDSKGRFVFITHSEVCM